MLKTRYNFLLCVSSVESMFTSEGSFTYGQYIFPDSTDNLFKDEMIKSIKNFSFSKSINNLKIEVSDVDNVAILGSAALYYDGKKIIFHY